MSAETSQRMREAHAAALLAAEDLSVSHAVFFERLLQFDRWATLDAADRMREAALLREELTRAIERRVALWLRKYPPQGFEANEAAGGETG